MDGAVVSELPRSADQTVDVDLSGRPGIGGNSTALRLHCYLFELQLPVRLFLAGRAPAQAGRNRYLDGPIYARAMRSCHVSLLGDLTVTAGGAGRFAKGA
jgi:hypothetical protein